VSDNKLLTVEIWKEEKELNSIGKNSLS